MIGLVRLTLGGFIMAGCSALSWAAPDISVTLLSIPACFGLIMALHGLAAMPD